MLRVLTDRGTEYCGQREHHEDQLYLAVENIDHTRTTASASGFTAIQEEFYATAFRKKLYHGLEEPQSDPDEWMREYNLTRTHSGKYYYGKLPCKPSSTRLTWPRNRCSIRSETERSPAQRERSRRRGRGRGCTI